MIALLLISCMLLTMFAFADEAEPIETTEPTETTESAEQTEPAETTEPTEPASPADEELIAQYHIPDNWARNALLFAVRNGILYGSGDGTLSPGKNATRAEIATILSRLLPTEHSLDLTVYEDLEADQWYYEPIGHAAAMGLISGTGETTMTPNGKATREQAFAMIARAFGLPAGEESTLYQFKDWTKVSNWAASSVAALIEAGYVSGSGGYLNPRNNITRQEFAQVLYSVFDLITPELSEQQDGTVLCCADSIPAGTVINGDLLLCNDAAELNLEGVTVTGKLILQGVDSVNVTISGCEIGELVLCRPADLHVAESEIPLVSVLKGKSSLSGSYQTVSVSAETELHGTAGCIRLCEGDLTVAEGASAEQLQAEPSAEGSTVTVNGTVTYAKIEAELTLAGSGSVASAEIRAGDFSPEPVLEEYSFTQDYGLSRLTGHGIMCGGTPKPGDATRVLEMTFDGPYPLENCDIEWSVNGVSVRKDENIPMNADTCLRHEYDFAPNLINDAECTVSVDVFYRGRSERFFFTVSTRQPNLIYDVTQVKTLDVPATVKYTTNLYAYSELTGYLGSAAYGTNVILKETSDTSAAKIRLPNGKTGWVPYSAIRISQGNYYTTKDYTPSVKEAWVNMKGYSSLTQYLVWCNLYTQRVNIFTGSQGNWKLVYSCQCATGSNNTPTPQEVVRIRYKSSQWDFGSYYVHHISVFDYSRGFHSMLYRYDSYTLYNTVMGCPASHGCVRVPDEGILYIWDNVPVDSTVVIY